MKAPLPHLSPKSRRVLEALAVGLDCQQIVRRDAGLTRADICAAAREALGGGSAETSAYDRRMAEIRSRYMRAYEPWSDEEDAELLDLIASRTSVADIAEHLGRQPSAISSRIRKLT